MALNKLSEMLAGRALRAKDTSMITNVAIITVLVIVGSVASIGFGVWHLFVPRIWDWYSYTQKDAIELIIAVKAINVFFSVSLILFGFMGSVVVVGNKSNNYSTIVV